MRRAGTLLLVTAALMSVVFVAAAVGHGVKYDSTITAKYKKEGKDPVTDPATLSGTVDSVKAPCKADRTVSLRMYGQDGVGHEVATDQTDAAGAWEIQQASFTVGTYYAQVGKKVLRKNSDHSHVCRKAVSADVDVK